MIVVALNCPDGARRRKLRLALEWLCWPYHIRVEHTDAARRPVVESTATLAGTPAPRDAKRFVWALEGLSAEERRMRLSRADMRRVAIAIREYGL